jgi:hypothetical protein
MGLDKKNAKGGPPATKQANMHQPNIAEENMPEIQPFIDRIDRLTNSFDFWNRWMLYSLILAGIAAIAVALTTRLAIVRAKQLSVAQGELDKAKDAIAKQQIEEVRHGTEELRKRNLELQKELIVQGPRVNLLYGKTAEDFISKLKPFPRQRVEIRYSQVSFNQFHIDNDTMGAAMRLQGLLGLAGWDVAPTLVTDNTNGAAIWVAVSSKASKLTTKAANALLDALRDVPLQVNDKPEISDRPRPPQAPAFSQGGNAITLPPLTPDTIVVTVLAHP